MPDDFQQDIIDDIREDAESLPEIVMTRRICSRCRNFPAEILFGTRKIESRGNKYYRLCGKCRKLIAKGEAEDIPEDIIPLKNPILLCFAQRDKNSFTITVRHGFANGLYLADRNGRPDFQGAGFSYSAIRDAKVIAPQDVWHDWFFNIEPEVITFDTIKKYIKPKISRDAVKIYSQTRLDDFIDDFWFCIQLASEEHPEIGGKKPRGSNKAGLSHKKLREMRHSAKHLYIYLKYWLKVSRSVRPEKLNHCLKEYKAENMKIKRTVQKIIGEKFKIKDYENDIDFEGFYKKYVVPLPHRLKNDQRIINGDSDHLRNILNTKLLK